MGERITVEEAAAALNVSVATARRYCATGRLSATKIGRQWLVDSDSVGRRTYSRHRPVPSAQTDVRLALKHLKSRDLKELWVPDVLRFEDILADPALVLADAAARANDAGPFDQASIVDVPKTPFLSRRGSLLSLEDRIAFHASVSSIAERVESSFAQLDKQANRTVVFSARRSTSAEHFLKDGSRSWVRFKDSIKEVVDSGYPWMIKTDIVSYFDNIQHRLLVGEIDSLNPPPGVSRALKAMLSEWSPHGGFGIPQGPDASRLLGNLYLLPVDQALVNGGCTYLRFMDDLRIFARSRRELIESFGLLERECGNRGLTLATHKTKTLQGDRARLDLDDPELQKISYHFDRRRFSEIRVLLRKVVKKGLAAAGDEGSPSERRIRFGLWRATLLTDSSLLSAVLSRLEYLGPLASLVAQYLRPFLSRKRVETAISSFIWDKERNTSQFMSTWLMAVMLDRPDDLPHEWVDYARSVTHDRNSERYHRVIAANVMGRASLRADISWLRNELLREFDPALARGFLVALARSRNLDKGTSNTIVARFPEINQSVRYLKSLNNLPSLVHSRKRVPIRESKH